MELALDYFSSYLQEDQFSEQSQIYLGTPAFMGEFYQNFNLSFFQDHPARHILGTNGVLELAYIKLQYLIVELQRILKGGD